MTCRSCRGTKIYRRPKPDNAINPRYPPEYDEVPCPDCAPKPFARVVSGSLFIGRHERPIDQSGYSLGTVVQLINAEVEASEATLRGNMAALRYLCRMARDSAIPTLFVDEVDEIASRDSEGSGPEYVIGDVACGLAFDLGAAKDKTEGVWGVLIDALLNLVENGDSKAHDLAWEVAGRLGMTSEGRWKPLSHRMDSITDTELAQECARRGWSFEAPPVQVDRGFRTRLEPARSGSGAQLVTSVRSRPEAELEQQGMANGAAAVAWRGEVAIDSIVDEYTEMVGAPPQLLSRAQLEPRHSIQLACMRAGLDYTQERHDYALAFMRSRPTTDPVTTQEVANALLAIE